MNWFLVFGIFLVAIGFSNVYVSRVAPFKAKELSVTLRWFNGITGAGIAAIGIVTIIQS